MKYVSGLIATAALLACTSASAGVLPVTTFGELKGATFGGSGIPNHGVVITTLGNLTLGLTATQRYFGDNLLNNGKDTFYADPGVRQVKDKPDGTTWNFSYFIQDKDQTALSNSNYTFSLLFDFDAGANTAESKLGIVDPTFFSTSGNTAQNSQNLMFPFLSIPVFGTTPPAGVFDATANGQYSFALVAYDKSSNAEVARAAMFVQVGPEASDVPEPASVALLGLGMSGLALARRRKQAR
ncbi:MAG: PEP-CTERM sorting domain-containing protein [Pseudomonadota bacterium]